MPRGVYNCNLSAMHRCHIAYVACPACLGCPYCNCPCRTVSCICPDLPHPGLSLRCPTDHTGAHSLSGYILWREISYGSGMCRNTYYWDNNVGCTMLLYSKHNSISGHHRDVSRKTKATKY